MIFGRRKNAEEAPKPGPEATGDVDLSVKPGARSPAAPTRPPVMPPRAPAEPPRPAFEAPPRRPDPTATQGAVSSTAKREPEMRKLIVGREISLSGEITSCDRLVVEGTVEANLANCREIEISDTGVFKGSASIDEAEVRGRFEGILNVRRRLLIRSTGKVVGTVRYGQIEVERGGQVSGDVQTQPSNEPPSVEAPRASGGFLGESSLA